MSLPEWSDARSAALFLKPCTPKHLNEELGVFLTRESGNRPGTRMDALGCSPLRAAQHFHAIRELNARELLVAMLGDLQDSIDRERYKRRHQ